MPELPEVEVVRRSLIGFVEGFSILAIEEHTPHFPLSQGILSQRIERFSRHGKWLFWEFSAQDALAIHLGMTGRLLVRAHRTSFPHEHLSFFFSSGYWISFCDQRRFGEIRYLLKREKDTLLLRLGIDPFSPSYTFERVRELLRGKRRLKDFLLDQEKIAGIGNIYASEILFRSKLHPERRLDTLREEEKQRLFTLIPQVCEEAVRCQGTSIRDFVGGEGEKGTFQDCLFVYGRAGLPCRACGTVIIRQVIGARSTYFCPRCQR